MADATPSQPPPLDPSLIFRARTVLNAAGLPGDAIGDEEIAGLVHEIGQFAYGMSLASWWNLEGWCLNRKVGQVAQSS